MNTALISFIHPINTQMTSAHRAGIRDAKNRSPYLGPQTPSIFQERNVHRWLEMGGQGKLPREEKN